MSSAERKRSVTQFALKNHYCEFRTSQSIPYQWSGHTALEKQDSFTIYDGTNVFISLIVTHTLPLLENTGAPDFLPSLPVTFQDLTEWSGSRIHARPQSAWVQRQKHTVKSGPGQRTTDQVMPASVPKLMC